MAQITAPGILRTSIFQNQALYPLSAWDSTVMMKKLTYVLRNPHDLRPRTLNIDLHQRLQESRPGVSLLHPGLLKYLQFHSQLGHHILNNLLFPTHRCFSAWEQTGAVEVDEALDVFPVFPVVFPIIFEFLKLGGRVGVWAFMLVEGKKRRKGGAQFSESLSPAIVSSVAAPPNGSLIQVSPLAK